MTWEKTNSSTMSKKETAIAFAEWLWEYVTGNKKEEWVKFSPWFDEEFEEEQSTEQMYNRWNKLNNQETN